MLNFLLERWKLVLALLLIIGVVWFFMTPDYTDLGFEEAEGLDGMFDRGGALITSSIMASAGLDAEYVSYNDIGYDDQVKIDINDKTVKGTYFGYNVQEGCHYVYLKKPFSGEKVYRISESSCDIYLN